MQKVRAGKKEGGGRWGRMVRAVGVGLVGRGVI